MAAATGDVKRRSFFREWILTVDHKKIGIMYAVTAIVFFFIGGLAALFIRTQLAMPGNMIIPPDMFNQAFTMHGTIMIFLWIIPMLTGAFGNYLVPIMIGAHDMAFPKMNALSYWLFLLGGLVLMSSFVVGAIPEVGWTAYPPYSIQSQGAGLDLWVTSVHILGLSSILAAINFIVTTFNMRAPGMTMNRMPLFVWANLVTSFIQLFGTPALAGAVTTLLMDRHLKTTFYDVAAGGDPMLYQHLFWFYSHPAVYVMIVPAMGIVSEIIPVFARKPIFGYKAIAYSSIMIGLLGFLVWAHHMFVAGMQLSAGIPFMITSLIIAVPTAIKIFNWLASLWGGQINYTTPMLYVTFGFIGLFTVGGLSGIVLGNVPLDLHLHDTYFVVAHFHYVLFGGSMMAIIAGTYFWFPKVTGKMYKESTAKIIFWTYFIGTNLTFFPMHMIGLNGMPRRVFVYTPDLTFLNQISTAGAFLVGLASLAFVIQICVATMKGEKASANPWNANTLEWTNASSPPTEFNFEALPIVTEDPYQYGEKPGKSKGNIA
ncbi:cytochrome c oxidase subunit I [Tumebacillus sp. DT12]|uniref:Cytochrome c oxidase subunit 1 n=1 Tax=Tumebacillus lacus TaxID=2995335 RepID=A0ABT3WZK5_9BACL|nr:cytochrome c oxidase subunit I [Tumebacillus lacus]MCX7570090.1 cytochrome c oxidase subunit I [Tumebacillus lacus]